MAGQLRRVTRNENDTWNTLDRQCLFPIIDAHCHVFGQSLLVDADNLHEWSDPNKVTFVKGGTNGKVRKTFPPAVVLEKPTDLGKWREAAGILDKVEEAGKTAWDHGVPETVKNRGVRQPISQIKGEAEKVKKDARSLAEQTVSELKQLPNKMGDLPGGLDDLPGGMEDIAGDSEKLVSKIEDAINDAREAADEYRDFDTYKVYARGVVEVARDEPWPPRAKVEQVGDRMCPVIKLTKPGAKIHAVGAGFGKRRHQALGLLLSERDDRAMMSKHITGNDGENAREVIDAVPLQRGRAVVALLLDLGFTPFSLHVAYHSYFATKVLNELIYYLGHDRALALPTSNADPSGLYPEDREYLFLDYKAYTAAVEAMARVNAEHAYKIWCMVGYDPRRAMYDRENPPKGRRALELVKHAVEKLGFVGVKLYSRCGWMPYNNEYMHGKNGKKIDRELDELYKYLVKEDLPALNHVSPAGFPPSQMHAYPKPYETDELYHTPAPQWGKIGFAPLPFNLKSLLSDLGDLKDSIQESFSPPSPDDVLEQAKSLGSSMLENAGKVLKDSKERLSKDAYETLREAERRARSDHQIDRLPAMVDPRKWNDERNKKQLLKYFDSEEQLRDLSSKVDLEEFFDLASVTDEVDFKNVVELGDPEREKAQQVQQKAGTAYEDARTVASNLSSVLDIFALFLANIACQEAGKACHYVQHTVSPHMWDPVLDKYPELRLNMAHAGSSNAIAAYYDEILEEADKATMNDELAEEQSDDDDSLEPVFKEWYANPMVASGKLFKEKGFETYAKTSTHVEEAVIKFISMEQLPKPPFIPKLVWKGVEKVIRMAAAALVKHFSEVDIRDAVREKIPEVVASGSWQKWLSDWEKEFPMGWFEKLNEQMGKYENVYCDISGSSPLPKAFLRRLAEDANPPRDGKKEYGDRPDLEMLKERLMIGTDWYMTTMEGKNAQYSWDHVQDVVDDVHPLWELWSNRNCVEYINLGPRMNSMEKFYRSRGVTEDAKPCWWDALKAHYGVEDEQAEDDSSSSPEDKKPQDQDEDNEKDEAEEKGESKEYTEYIIKEGDWLSKIAPCYGMTWQQLYNYDGGTGKPNSKRLKSGDPDLIFPGEEILVPKQ